MGWGGSIINFPINYKHHKRVSLRRSYVPDGGIPFKKVSTPCHYFHINDKSIYFFNCNPTEFTTNIIFSNQTFIIHTCHFSENSKMECVIGVDTNIKVDHGKCFF